jgi:hypothetical protein
MGSRRPFIGAALLIGVAAASVSVSCSSSETSVATAPSGADRCQVAVSNSSTTPFPASGGTGAVNVSTARDCTWSASTDAGWLTISPPRDGQGNGVVSFSVAANPAPAARSGTIAVGSERVQLSQAAAPCRYSLNRSSGSVAAAGGRLSFDVATLTGCAWNAVSTANWITITSGQSGSANGTVGLTIAANTGAARTGQVNAGGQAFTVTQAAAMTEPPPPPPPPTPSVHLEGTALLVSGSCPDVTFYVNLRRVVTNRSTNYDDKSKCGDLQTGRQVEVDGTDNGSAVVAVLIQIGKDH